MKEVTNKGVVTAIQPATKETQTSKPSETTVYTLIEKTADIIAEGLGSVADYFTDKTRTATSVDGKAQDKNEDGTCPKCKNDITLNELKKICVDKNGNCLISDGR